jgi:hypothetical protein
VLKDKFTNYLAVIAIVITSFLGVSATLDLKLPNNVQLLLTSLAAGLSGGVGFATGKDDNLKSKSKDQ